MQNSSLETKGRFFIPEYPDDLRYGNLVVNGNSITLETLEGLPDKVMKEKGKREIFASENKPEYEKVLGLTNEGSVALIKNHFGRTIRWKFLTETTEKFSMAFVSEEDLKANPGLEFKEIILRIVRLKDFVVSSNIVQKITSEKHSLFKYIEVKAHISNTALSSFATKGYKVYFEPNYIFSLEQSNDPLLEEFPIKEFVSIRIVKRKGKFTKESMLEIIYHIRNFIAFALQDPIYFTSIQLRNKLDHSDKLGRKYLTTEVYISEKDYKTIDKSDKRRYLFRLPDIQTRFSSYLDKWFEMKNSYPILYDNYFRYLYAHGDSWENIFLKLVIGAEEYFKKSKEFLDTITLPKDIIIDDKDSLIRRFAQIRETLPRNVKKELTLDDMKLIRDIRNNIAHTNVSSEDVRKIKSQDLLLKLVKICEACLMKEIGFDKKLIENSIDRHKFV